MKMAVSQELIKKLAIAIANAEGFGRPGSIPTRANNPGDITDDGDLGYGVIQSSGPHGAAISIYPTAEEGWHALYRKIHRAMCGASHVYKLEMSIAEIGIKWSGDPAWAKNVAHAMGCECDCTLEALVLADAQAQAPPVTEPA